MGASREPCGEMWGLVVATTIPAATCVAMSDLTPKQERFVREYLIDLNATQAAIRAGYSANGADTAGPRLLERPGVKAVIDCGKLQRSERTEITSDRVLEEIAAMAFYDPAELLIAIEATDNDVLANVEIVGGKVITGLRSASDIRHLPENVWRAIVGWGYDRNQNFTIKLADKSKALDQLARHLSLYNDKLELSGVEALADRLARATRRDDVPAAIPVPTPVAVPDPKPAPVQSKQPNYRPDHHPPETPGVDAIIAAKPPEYEPILPTWPESTGCAAVDYDPTSGSYDLK